MCMWPVPNFRLCQIFKKNTSSKKEDFRIFGNGAGPSSLGGPKKKIVEMALEIRPELQDDFFSAPEKVGFTDSKSPKIHAIFSGWPYPYRE